MQTNKWVLLAVVMVVASMWPTLAESQNSPRAKAIEFWDDHTPSSGLKPIHQSWQEILDVYLIDDHPSGVNRFNYDQVSELDQQKLIDYLAYLQNQDPRQLTKQRQKAYWINLYNATLVTFIVTTKPKDSIRRLNRTDFWDVDRFTVAQQRLSFNDIEHGILRPLFQDERVHFALFRGSVGSANLAKKTYLGDTIDEDLEGATKAFVTHPRAVSFNNKELRLSRIFKWKEDDFGSNTEGVKVFIKQYLDPEAAQKVDQSTRVRYQFDWMLNKPE